MRKAVLDWLSGVTLRRALVLGAVALIARGLSLGHPDYHVDETFYLMTGDAMRHGALPYVDIWDRKPLGLFLFYALLTAISPTVWSYQLAAMVFVTITGMLVAALARRWSDEPASLLAGACYIVWLGPLEGGGGQTPVFYTVFIVGAVWSLVDAALDSVSPATLARTLVASLLCGIAIWFKPTALFESAFVVLGFGWLDWSRRRRPLRALVLLLMMGMVVALPSLAGFAWYAAQGHLAAMWQATVLSNFNRKPLPGFVARTIAYHLIIVTIPLCISTALGLYQAAVVKLNSQYFVMIVLWLIAGLCGFFVVPNFFSHYALPLVPIMAVLSAPYFAKHYVGWILALFSIAWALSVGQSFAFGSVSQASQHYYRMISVIRDNMPHHTLYVYKGSPWIYHEAGAKRLTRFVFPEHLDSSTEIGSIGIDPAVEVRHIISLQPDVIFIEDNLGPDYNRTTFKMLFNEISANYTLVCIMPGQEFLGHFHYFIFARSRNPNRSHCLAGGA